MVSFFLNTGRHARLFLHEYVDITGYFYIELAGKGKGKLTLHFQFGLRFICQPLRSLQKVVKFGTWYNVSGQLSPLIVENYKSANQGVFGGNKVSQL